MSALVPGWARLLCGAICVVVGLSALAGLIASPLPNPKPAWGMFIFEPVQLIAAVFGVLFARGRHNESPALALLCVAGVFVLASALAYVAIQREPIGKVFGPIMFLRIAGGFALVATAAVLVLNRRPRSWRTFFIGAGLLTPLVLMGGAVAMGVGRSLVQSVFGMGGFGGFVVQLLAFIVVTGLLAAGVHLVIRAFETANRDV